MEVYRSGRPYLLGVCGNCGRETYFQMTYKVEHKCCYHRIGDYWAMKDFPEKLIAVRLSHGLQVNEVAKDVLGIAGTYYGSYERGSNIPSDKRIQQLCAFYGVVPEELGFYDISKAKRNFPERLCRERERKNLTKVELGDQSGVNATLITHYEKGDRFPSYEGLMAICRVLGVEIQELLPGVPDEEDFDAAYRRGIAGP